MTRATQQAAFDAGIQDCLAGSTRQWSYFQILGFGMEYERGYGQAVRNAVSETAFR